MKAWSRNCVRHLNRPRSLKAIGVRVTNTTPASSRQHIAVRRRSQAGAAKQNSMLRSASCIPARAPNETSKRVIPLNDSAFDAVQRTVRRAEVLGPPGSMTCDTRSSRVCWRLSHHSRRMLATAFGGRRTARTPSSCLDREFSAGNRAIMRSEARHLSWTTSAIYGMCSALFRRRDRDDPRVWQLIREPESQSALNASL